MAIRKQHHRPFGATGIIVPPFAFRADVLESSLRVLPGKAKRLIFGTLLQAFDPPIFMDVRVNEQFDSLASTLSGLLNHFDAAPEDVVIHFELEALSTSQYLARPHGVRTQFETACAQLGRKYSVRLVSLRVEMDDTPTVPPSILDSLHELESLKTEHQLAAVGVALQDWRLGPRLQQSSKVDFFKLWNGPTILRHPPEMLNWLAELAAMQVPVISAGVFHGGFLVGGSAMNGRSISPNTSANQSLIAWRKSFAALCLGHGVRPAHACIQFALRTPGIVAASLSASHVDRVAENVYAATTPVPDALWVSLKEEGLLAGEYPYLVD